MRHRRRGRILGRNPKHQRALLKNLASSLFLTERDAEFDENAPKVKGRIVTTMAKAKEVRPLVEKCITVAKRAQSSLDAAAEYEASSEKGTDGWKSWRESQQWHDWNKAIAPAVAARRRCIKLLGDKEAVSVLFEEVAPRFIDRPGGYTRVVRLAQPRLGDAGVRAILELVGVRDRKTVRSEKPSFEDPDTSLSEDESDESSGLSELSEVSETDAVTDEDEVVAEETGGAQEDDK